MNQSIVSIFYFPLHYYCRFFLLLLLFCFVFLFCFCFVFVLFCFLFLFVCLFFYLPCTRFNIHQSNRLQLSGRQPHMSVDIKCLSIDPPFYADLTPNDRPFIFLQSTPNDPLFPLSYQILHTKCKFPAHFEKFTNFAVILT